MSITLIEPGITIRHMDRADFDLVSQWCIEEGWNIGVHDASIHYHLDPKGHFILETSEAIAAISLIKHAKQFFTLGPFIVKKEYRHHGYGQKIWQHAFSKIEPHTQDKLVVLYAVLSQAERYRQEGFTPLFLNQRWEIHPQQSSPPDSPKCLPITAEQLQSVIAYDKKIFFSSRETVFSQLLHQPRVKGLLYSDDKKIKGMGWIRPCIRGYRLGPLVADNTTIAKKLIEELIQGLNGETVILDMPDCNTQGINLMKELGSKRQSQDDTLAMYKGYLAPDKLKDFNQYYGVFSLEIG